MTAISEQRTHASALPGLANPEHRHRYALNFAPHLGIVPGGAGLFAACAGPDVLDQIRFISDQGFDAVEDNFFSSRPVPLQQEIGHVLADHSMQMGCMLGVTTLDRPTFGLDTAQAQSSLQSELRHALAAAERAAGKLLTIIPGRENPGVDRSQQIRNVIRNLEQLAPMAEAAGITLVIEAISRKRWQDILVADVKEACSICRAVDSPAVGLLFDVYQCQCESGDIISHMEHCWDQIRCVQIADNPGRMEPGTGEINFFNVLAYLKQRDWTGLVEMEHGLSKPGAQAGYDLIQTYRALSDSISGLSRKSPWELLQETAVPLHAT